MKGRTLSFSLCIFLLLAAGCATQQIQKQIQALGDEDRNVRRNTASALVKIGAPAVEPLIKAIGDENWRVRENATEALGKIGDPRAVEPLIKALGVEVSGVRFNAALALVKIGAPAVEPLIKALGDKNSDVRKKAAEALGEIGDSRAVEPLIKTLGDESQYVRDDAAEALGSLGWKPTNRIEKIKYYLAKKEWDKLVAIGAPAVEPLIKALGDGGYGVGEKATEALGKIGDSRAVEPLIKALGGDYYSDVRKSAAKALNRIGDSRAVEALIKALGDEDSGVRFNAVLALGTIGDPRAVEPFIKALGDNSSYVRRHAAEALGEIGDSRAVEPLIKALGGDYYSDVRKSAAKALSKIGAPAIEPLIKAATVDSLINPWVINVLLDMQVTGPEAIELYICSLNLDSDDLRLKVANIILNSNDPQAVKARPQARQVIASIIYITEIVNYGNYGRAASSVLKNRAGQEVAKKEIWFSPYNPTIKSAEVITDLITGYQFQAVIYDDYGRPKNPMWLCLDKKGNIIRRSGKPVLVKPFDAQQKSEFEIVNNVRGFKDKKITKIYPCDNCAGQTGEKNCKYVW